MFVLVHVWFAQSLPTQIGPNKLRKFDINEIKIGYYTYQPDFYIYY